MKNQYLEAGKIVGTHGIKGELKVDPWMDSPEALKKFKKLYFENGSKNAGLISSRVHKNQLLVTLEGVNTVDEGEALKGKTLYFDRGDANLPKNRFFISDLIGLEVYDAENNQYYGTIEEVFMTGANNVYRIANGSREYLFPAVDSMIKSTDIEAGRIEVLPIQGIFDGDALSDADNA